jgi:hypothetical protein
VDRQRSDADAGVVEDDDGTRVEVCADPGEVCVQQCGDGVGATSALTSEDDDRWSRGVALSKELAEVSVAGDDHAIVGARERKYLMVRCFALTQVPEVDGVVPEFAEQRDQFGREVLVEEQPSRRGAQRELALTYCKRGIAKALGDVLCF